MPNAPQDAALPRTAPIGADDHCFGCEAALPFLDGAPLRVEAAESPTLQRSVNGSGASGRRAPAPAPQRRRLFGLG